MNDFIQSLAFVLFAYLCGVAYVVAMARMFFPLKSKEEWTRIHALKTVSNNHRVSRMRRMSHAMGNQNGQLA